MKENTVVLILDRIFRDLQQSCPGRDSGGTELRGNYGSFVSIWACNAMCVFIFQHCYLPG